MNGWRAARLGASAVAVFALATAAADPLDDYLRGDGPFAATTLRARLPATPTFRWLQDPELRVSPERDIRNLDTETYSLRAQPTSARERASNRELFEIETRLAVLEFEQDDTDDIASRYRQIVELAGLEVELELARQRAILERSVLGTQSVFTGDTQFSLNKVLDATIRAETRQRQREALQRRVELLRGATVNDLLRVADGRAPRLTTALATPLRVGRLLTDVAQRVAVSAPLGVRARLEVARAREELALAEVRSGFGLNLMELRYENKGTDSYGITVGFRLPFGQRSGSAQRRTRELISAQHNARRAEALIATRVQRSLDEIGLLVERCAQQDAALTRLDERQHAAVSDVAALATLREHQLELLGAAADSHTRLLREFVDLLDLAGLLDEAHNHNWLRGDRS